MAQLSENDIIGVVDWKPRSVNGYGEEAGRYWEGSSGTIGYEGDDYVAAQNLAKRLAEVGPLSGVPGLICTSEEETHWNEESEWHEGRSTNLNRW